MPTSGSEPYSDLIARVESAAAQVEASDAAAAQRVLEIARQVQIRERRLGRLIGQGDDATLRRELNRHFELLSRRGARALPVAALARLLLADLAGSRSGVADACRDCDKKLQIFGL